MEEILAGVSWMGVIVGAIVSFVLGALWFSPMMFGKKWAAGNNLELGSAASMPMGAMVSQAVALFLISWFVGVTAVESHLFTYILAVLGFGVLTISNGLFAKKPPAVVGIDFGYLIAISVIMFVSQGVF